MKDKTNGVEALEALEIMNRALILKCVPKVYTNKLYAIIKQALLQAVEYKKKVEEICKEMMIDVNNEDDMLTVHT